MADTTFAAELAAAAAVNAVIDQTARTTASTAAVDPLARRRTRLLRLQDAFAAASARNPITSSAMSAPPTVTVSATADATLAQLYTFAAGGSIIAPSLTSAADKVNWLGGLPKVYANTNVTQVTSTFFPNVDGNMAFPAAQAGTDPTLTADMNMVLGGFEVSTTAPTIEFRLYLDTTMRVCFLVDGLFTDKAGYTATTGTTVRSDYYKLAFGSAASRKITVLLTASPQTRATTDPNQGLQGFSAVRSIAVASGYLIWKPSQVPLRLGVFGDSYGTGVGGNNASGTWQVPGQTYPVVLGWSLGLQDVRAFCIGSTGYEASGQGRLNMLAALPRFMSMYGGSLGLDVAIVGHGYNDTLTSSAGVLAALVALRATDADMPIFVLGSQSGATGPSARILANEVLIKAAVDQMRAAGDKLIAFIPVSPSVVGAWTYGTGNAAAPNGTDASNIDVASDGTHPTIPYANKIGVRGAEGVRQALSQMLAAT